ncbi:MAG TPA: GAF and ANTAR domain-containing protein [Acidimicrobiales bacterium]
MTDVNNRDTGPELASGLGGAVLDDAALTEMLQRLVLLAQHTLSGADSVSITVAENGRFRTSNSTGPTALAIDQVQYEQDDGPCLHAMRSKEQLQFVVDAAPVRWPSIDDAARAAGITSVLSTPLLRSPGEAIGALNIYGSETAFNEAELRTAGLVSEHASILVGNALDLLSATELNHQMREAVASREIIGEAKGIIMERQGCTRDEAFDVLRRASQRENRKLRDLAEELVLRVEARAARRGPSST